MTPVIVGVVVAVIVTLGVVLGVRRMIAARKVKTAARLEAEALQSLREVPSLCRKNGHAYQHHGGGYQCVECGNYISSREGESFGLATEGRVDRRRRPR